MNEKISIGEISAESGTKNHGWLKVTNRPDGSLVGIPVIIVNGVERGPTLVADACHHGDEYEGAEAIIKVGKMLDPSELKGTFIGVPALNIGAFEANTRMNPQDFAKLDMNRVYPGNPNGFVTERVAYAYFNKVVTKADAVMTFHGGGSHSYFEPLVVTPQPTDELNKRTFELAKAFGTEVIWLEPKDKPLWPGTLDGQAKMKGIPTFAPEAGGQAHRYERRHYTIDLCARGINNVMKQMGMLEGTPEVPTKRTFVEMIYLYSPAGGIQTPQVKLGEMVSKGTVLNRITDVFGEEIATVVAPIGGLICCQWILPITNAGDWICNIGKVTEEPKPQMG